MNYVALFLRNLAGLAEACTLYTAAGLTCGGVVALVTLAFGGETGTAAAAGAVGFFVPTFPLYWWFTSDSPDYSNASSQGCRPGSSRPFVTELPPAPARHRPGARSARRERLSMSVCRRPPRQRRPTASSLCARLVETGLPRTALLRIA